MLLDASLTFQLQGIKLHTPRFNPIAGTQEYRLRQRNERNRKRGSVGRISKASSASRHLAAAQ